MCKLFRYLCICCRMMYLPSPEYYKLNNICSTFYFLQDPFYRYYWHLKKQCLSSLILIPRDKCRWCSAHCKKLTPCQQVNDMEEEMKFGPMRLVSRFYHEQTGNNIHYPKEIQRFAYHSKEDLEKAKLFFEQMMHALF
jgi:hypothetical protein